MADTAVCSPSHCAHSFPPPPPRDVPIIAPAPLFYTLNIPTRSATTPVDNGGTSLDYGEVIRSLRKIGPIKYDQEVTKKLTVAADVLRKEWEVRNRARLERLNAYKVVQADA